MEKGAHDCQSMSDNMSNVNIASQHETMNMSHSAHHDMSRAQMSDNKVDADETVDNCCETDCSCPSNMCSSVHYLTSLGSNTLLSVSSEKISIYSAGQLIQQPNALLRPPIIA